MEDPSCEICMEMFDEGIRRPKSLQCGHTMCLSCIERLRTCPWDEQAVESPGDLKDNVYLVRIITDTGRKSRFWCLNCEKIADKKCLNDHTLFSLKMFRQQEVQKQTLIIEKFVSLHDIVIDKLLSIGAEFSATIQRLVDDVTLSQSELQDSLNRLQDIVENGGSEEAWLAVREQCVTTATRAEQSMPAVREEARLLDQDGRVSLKLWDRDKAHLQAFVSLDPDVEDDAKPVLLLALFLLQRAGKLHNVKKCVKTPTHRGKEEQAGCSTSKTYNGGIRFEGSNGGAGDGESDSENEAVGVCLRQEKLARDKKEKEKEERKKKFKNMVALENGNEVVKTAERFECPVCMTMYDSNEGVVLRECLHSFCRNCLADVVEFASEAEVKCPYRDEVYACEEVLQEREIKALVSSKVYQQYLKRSVSQAESLIQNTFHCQTTDCAGWCEFEYGVNLFICPICNGENCLTCQVLHPGENCQEYQGRIKFEAQTNQDALKTQQHMDQMLKTQEAMKCPKCGVVITKRAGCDAIICSMCRTAICWATRGPRWGPKGQGDTSGGCKCSINGKKCHPLCGNCH